LMSVTANLSHGQMKKKSCVVTRPRDKPGREVMSILSKQGLQNGNSTSTRSAGGDGEREDLCESQKK